MQKQVINTFFNKIENEALTVKYWDGDEKKYGNGNPSLKLVFNKPLPLSFSLDDPMMSIGEAYMDDLIDFEGNFDDVMKIVAKNRTLMEGNKEKLFAKSIETINKMSFIKKQKENIRNHYDLGNDFFNLWLDETMSYSCAYFKNPEETLFEAQIDKIDHILKKLQLKPGEKLLDIGSGWGCLIIRAAQQYGVKATGITISEEQYKHTKEEIVKLGLEGQVEVKLQDYLDLKVEEQQFDKIVSVGMFEHVGKDNLSTYMAKVDELLKPEGISLLHSIIGDSEDGVNSWIEKYIFPGGYIPSLSETMGLLPDFDFHLIHLESLRMHYAMTLDNWYENYKKNWDYVEDRYGRRFARMWELYLKACASNFRAAGLDVYQILFSKGLNNDLSLKFGRIYS